MFTFQVLQVFTAGVTQMMGLFSFYTMQNVLHSVRAQTAVICDLLS
jgi:hypothetical protein